MSITSRSCLKILLPPSWNLRPPPVSCVYWLLCRRSRQDYWKRGKNLRGMEISRESPGVIMIWLQTQALAASFAHFLLLPRSWLWFTVSTTRLLLSNIIVVRFCSCVRSFVCPSHPLILHQNKGTNISWLGILWVSIQIKWKWLRLSYMRNR